MNLNFRFSQGELNVNVKLTWDKKFFRFVYSGTMNAEKSGLTYTLTKDEWDLRHTYSRSKWDLILY